MAAAAILLFEKFEILTICPLMVANLRHCAKFYQNRSNCCGDMDGNHAKFRKDRSIHCSDIAIFEIFQDGCRRYLVFFEKLQILTICPLYGANLRLRAKFHQNRSNGC